jgi:hypothetical protein
MRVWMFSLPITFIVILGADLGHVKPSLAEGQVRQTVNRAQVQLRPFPSPVPMLGAQPEVYSGIKGLSIEPEDSLCFLRRSDGSVINLTQLCGGSRGVQSVESGAGIERARRIEGRGY